MLSHSSENPESRLRLSDNGTFLGYRAQSEKRGLIWFGYPLSEGALFVWQNGGKPPFQETAYWGEFWLIHRLINVYLERMWFYCNTVQLMYRVIYTQEIAGH